MKKVLWCLICSLTLLGLTAAESAWLTDLDKALAKAKAENKLVLINFTGSDW